ncbi:O-antigen ligase family protein [Piscinibacter sakaiensis]|uniref:O-antigen ligase family protein n=1 Tax=Piscinibacter sakaiensis TaxID=1547922 RepID=UPI003AAE2D75
MTTSGANTFAHHSSAGLWIIATTVVVGGSLGIAAAVLPWWMVSIGLVLPLLAAVALAWPFLGLLGLIILLSGMIPSWILPQINLGPGKILGTDLALTMLVVLACLKALANGNDSLKDGKPLALPVVVFLLAIIPCSMVGYFVYHTSPREVLNEARVQIYWLVFFLPLFLVAKPRDLNRIAWGLAIIGVTLACMVIAQFILGVHLLEHGRMEDLRTAGTKYEDVTRSTAGGAIYLIIFALYFLTTRILTKTLRPIVAFPLLVLLAAGIIATFGRGIWLTCGIGLCGIAIYLGGARALNKVLIFVCIGSVMALGSLAIFKPQVVGASFERFTSTFGEGEERSSLGERLEENGFALNKIASSPIFGIGFGTAYKPRTDPGVDWHQVRYIHNGYLGLWLKLGLVGPLAAGWLVFAVVRRCRILLHRELLSEPNKGLLIACLTAFLVPVVTSITQPEWLTSLGVSFFALMAGIIAVMGHLFRVDTEQTN